MKKLILICVSVTVLSTALISQDNGEFKVRQQTTKEEKKKKDKEESDEKAFGKGKLVIVAGYGYPNLYRSIFKNLIANSSTSAAGYNYAYDTKGFGPCFLRGEYGITKWFGVGLIL